MSQYDMRTMAASSMVRTLYERYYDWLFDTTFFERQWQYSLEYLVSVNDEGCAEKVLLATEEWDPKSGDATDFIAWVKVHLQAGHAVTMSVYMNQFAFHDSIDKDDGDSDYDHIVPVLGIESKYNDALYHADDIIYFSDNGESACIGASNMHVCDDFVPQFYYKYTVSDFIGSRQSANAIHGNVYTLPMTSYGIAHTGVLDDEGDTLRIQISTD